MNVRDLMTPDPITVDFKAPVGEVRETMEKNGIRHIPVVEDGRVMGLLSTRDMAFIDGVLDLFADLDDFFAHPIMEMPVESLWSMEILPGRAVITVMPEAPIADAIDLLIMHQISALPVVDGETSRLLGILSYVDILKWARQVSSEG
ncbi:MAG: HPP family protein [Bradymonadaceae bacterium]